MVSGYALRVSPENARFGLRATGAASFAAMAALQGSMTRAAKGVSTQVCGASLWQLDHSFLPRRMIIGS